MAPQPAPNKALSENRFVAEKLDEVAQLLDQQNASLFRVRAYRDAASYLRGLPHPVRLDYQRGVNAGWMICRQSGNPSPPQSPKYSIRADRACWTGCAVLPTLSRSYRQFR